MQLLLHDSSQKGTLYCTPLCIPPASVCVALFLLNRYWGIVPVPGSFPSGRRPGVCVCVCVTLFCVCVCYFVLLNIGEIAVPVSFLKSGDLGWLDSAPSTLTTSLAILVPSSSSSNGPKTTPLITRGLCPGASIVWAGPKFVRTHR